MESGGGGLNAENGRRLWLSGGNPHAGDTVFCSKNILGGTAVPVRICNFKEGLEACGPKKVIAIGKERL